MTLEGWADMVYELQDARGLFIFLYFAVLILLGVSG